MPYVATYNTRQMPLGRLHLLLGLPRVKSLLIDLLYHLNESLGKATPLLTHQ